MTNHNHLTQQALSDRWGISIHTLARWRCNGHGPEYLKIGGNVLYTQTAVASYEKKNTHLSTSQRKTSPETQRKETLAPGDAV